MRLLIVLSFAVLVFGTGGVAEVVRSSNSGNWTDAMTWENEQLPAAGDRILIRRGHHVVYDRNEPAVLRSVHVAGKLSFATDRDTRLDVGLIRIAADESMPEEGFECLAAHEIHKHAEHNDNNAEPCLEVGTLQQPVAAEYTAIIRLVYFDEMDRESLPAVVCCGGRMDFHGAPMNRTWVKLGDNATVGDTRLFLQSKVSGWKPGDRILITGTSRQRPFTGTATRHVKDKPSSEVRTITAIDMSERIDEVYHLPGLLTLDKPLEHPHRAEPGYAGEIANLSRNVVVESADPESVRGHTMYHRSSSGSISYTEFRHLGKEGVLGRYPIHYHLVGDTMRGSSVCGASIWDSGNRWVTIHGTQYLVVRDCIGYQSVGHGYYLEDGSEVYNVLDRNLAVQALNGKPLPKQALPFDKNDGGGFWWANSLNAFTRNVAVECDQHGFRFEAVSSEDFDTELEVLQPDGSRKRVDIRTLPFIRFENNEAHTQRRFAFNLGGIRGAIYGALPINQADSVGGDVGGVGPDPAHPFKIKNYKCWDSHWAFHCGSPSVQIEGLDIYDCQYGIWRSVMSLHEYRDINLRRIKARAIHFPMGGYGPKIEVKDNKPSFPGLKPVDDLQPVTIITKVHERLDGFWEVQGTTVDNGQVEQVEVNQVHATAERPNFAQWTVVVPQAEAEAITAFATDHFGNKETRPHKVRLNDVP